eukprot:2175531-Pyramimonas_sp.AAC.1
MHKHLHNHIHTQINKQRGSTRPAAPKVAVRRACTLGAFERELAASFAGGAVGDWLRSSGPRRW